MQIGQAFGTIMKKFRLARRLSQTELAVASQLDRTFVSMLERGLRQPSLTTIITISETLEVPPEELVRQTIQLMKNPRRSRGIPSRRI